MSIRKISLASILLLMPLTAFAEEEPDSLTAHDISHAEKLIGLKFTDATRDSMLDGMKYHLVNYDAMRKISVPNSALPAMVFRPVPIVPVGTIGMKLEKEKKPFRIRKTVHVIMPDKIDDLAFYSVRQLGELIRTKKITSVQLTRMYLDRLKKYGPKLECVVTLTESLAIAQAERADAEIAAGKYRGLLHGIPYGAKDLLATKGIRTTWGSAAYKDQMIDQDATVIKRLEEAGAVLVAKLTLGELAWGDVWFGGMTRNPWNYDQGSSGSSAGSASATAAGLVGFAIGSETWGSIVSPSTVCGTSGLRPTFGRVSRAGAMTLSWSMDKLGPICRTAEDCAIVFNAIYGPDGLDPTVYDLPFNYEPEINLSRLRVGYVKNEFDSLKENKDLLFAALDSLKRLGAHLIPIELPKYPINSLSIILSAEAGAAFDDLLRSGRTDLMVRQIKDAWPNEFRLSRFIPAVEYVQANRIREMVIQEMAGLMDTIDLYVAPPFGDNLLLTNLTGHPCVVVPCGFTKEGTPTSITFMGRLFGEAELIAVAKQYQEATGYHLKHPTLKE